MENYYSRLNSWLFEKEKGKVSIKGNATLRTEISEELAISIRSILRGKGYKLAVVDASWPYIKNYPQLRTRVRGRGGETFCVKPHSTPLNLQPPFQPSLQASRHRFLISQSRFVSLVSLPSYARISKTRFVSLEEKRASRG